VLVALCNPDVIANEAGGAESPIVIMVKC